MLPKTTIPSQLTPLKTMPQNLNRRKFLKLSTVVGGGLILRIGCPSLLAEQEEGPSPQWNESLHPCIQIHPDNSILIRVYKQEMGQGASTGLAMIIADEMDVDWSTVRVETIGIDRSIQNEGGTFGRQDTGGSFSIVSEWTPMRVAGASLRALMIQAAAQLWNVPETECSVRESVVEHPESGQKARFADLADLAAQLTLPENPVLKEPSAYRIIGKPLPSLNSSKVVTGQLKYTSDIQLPRMAVAMIIRPPALGSTVKTHNCVSLEQLQGVVAAFPVDPIESDRMYFPGIRGGIAIVAESTAACFQARNQLQVEWTPGHFADQSSEHALDKLGEIEFEKANIRFSAGETVVEPSSDALSIEASYQSPYIAHGLMEPLNAVADFRDNKLDIWVGTQAPYCTWQELALAFEIPHENITIHSLPMGGGFGRRFFADFVVEAAVVSRQTKRPIKLLWSREDDTKFDFVHPMRMDRWKATLRADGSIASVSGHSVTKHQRGGMFDPFIYAADHQELRYYHHDEQLLQCGAWRAVASHLDTYSSECFIDEIAIAAKRDPLDYRIDALASIEMPKFEGNQAWVNEALPPHRRLLRQAFIELRTLCENDPSTGNYDGRGVAGLRFHGRSVFAMAAFVDRDPTPTKRWKLKKVICVLDVGLVVNPNLVQAQMEGGILWALTPIIHGGVDVQQGEIAQSNFDTLRITRMSECPELEIHLRNFENRDPQVVGEVAVPAVAPAVLNAIYAATGRRIRRLDASRDTWN